MKKHSLDELIDLMVDVARQKAKTTSLDLTCSELPSTLGSRPTCKTRQALTIKSESVGKWPMTKDSSSKKV